MLCNSFNIEIKETSQWKTNPQRTLLTMPDRLDVHITQAHDSSARRENMGRLLDIEFTTM